MAVTADTLRTWANLPADVPGGFLDVHIGAALRDLLHDTGAESAPTDSADWDEALHCRALASALPHLHTFSLHGAAKVARLVESLDLAFLNPDEVDAAVRRLATRYDELVARLVTALDDPDDDTQVGLPIGMEAI